MGLEVWWPILDNERGGNQATAVQTFHFTLGLQLKGGIPPTDFTEPKGCVSFCDDLPPANQVTSNGKQVLSQLVSNSGIYNQERVNKENIVLCKVFYNNNKKNALLD